MCGEQLGSRLGFFEQNRKAIRRAVENAVDFAMIGGACLVTGLK